MRKEMSLLLKKKLKKKLILFKSELNFNKA